VLHRFAIESSIPFYRYIFMLVIKLDFITTGMKQLARSSLVERLLSQPDAMRNAWGQQNQGNAMAHDYLLLSDLVFDRTQAGMSTCRLPFPSYLSKLMTHLPAGILLELQALWLITIYPYRWHRSEDTLHI
jgi:hypothetical protein